MNKYMTLGMIVVILILLTITADSLYGTNQIDVFDPDSSGENNASISAIFSMIGTFFRIITFRIEAMPVILTVMIFYPLAIIVVYMVVDILKDLIPFT